MGRHVGHFCSAMSFPSRLTSSKLLRNVAAVVSGTVAGQAVVFAFSPLITRIYSPEVFGLQGVFLSLISILSPAIALRYPMAIVVAKNEEDAQQLSRLALLIAFAMSCLFSLVLLIGHGTVLTLLGAEALGALIWFLPLALFCVALQEVMDYRTARIGAFGLIAKVTVAQAFITNLARVLGGLFAPVASTLVTVTSVAPALEAAMLKAGTQRRMQSAVALTRAGAMTLLKAHRDFPLYRMPTDVLNAVAQSSPVLLLSILFSPSAAGFYTIARSVVNLPLNVIGSAVGNVFYARIAEMARGRSPLFPFVLKATLLQLAIPGAATLLAALAFPSLFAFVFGGSWRPAGEFAQWMSLWVVCMLTNIPSVRALPVIGRQNVHLLFNTLIMIGGILGLLVGYALWQTASGAVAMYSVVTATIYAVQIITYLRQVRKYDRKHPYMRLPKTV